MRRFIVTSILLVSFNTFADCGNGFECVKSGDEALSNGNFSRAIENYTAACRQGLRAGCESVEEAKQKSAKIQSSSNTSSNKSAPFNAFDVVSQCTGDSAAEVDCLKKAKDLRQKSFLKSSIEIQQHFCSRESAQACFELGVTLVKSNNQEEARKAYLNSCSLGEPKACEVSKSLSASVSIEENRVERERQIHQEENAELKRKEQEEIAEYRRKEQEEKRKKVKTKCTTQRYGNSLETVCGEEGFL